MAIMAMAGCFTLDRSSFPGSGLLRGELHWNLRAPRRSRNRGDGQPVRIRSLAVVDGHKVIPSGYDQHSCGKSP